MKASIKWRNFGAGIVEHKIYRDTTSMNPLSLPSPIATISASSESYDDTTVADGTTYYYIVGTVYSGGEKLSSEISLTPSSTDPLVADCVLSCTMSELTGSVYTEEINGNDFTISSGGTVGNGPKGDSFIFNGSNYLSSGSVAPLVTDTFTLSFWIKHLAGSSNYRVFDYPGNFSIYIFNNAININNYSGSDFDTISAASLLSKLSGRWCHILVTFNSGTATCYLQGQPVGSVVVTHSSYSTTSPIYLGAKDGTSSELPSGSELSLVRLYDSVLSLSNIRRLTKERTRFAA